MKALARSRVWWPDIDREIEGMTSRCKGCREVRQDPKLTPIHPWEFPEGLLYIFRTALATILTGNTDNCVQVSGSLRQMHERCGQMSVEYDQVMLAATGI